ncbi:hypothetical protein V473_17195 [Sphingobium cupriresistens LL01]|uniref:Uncharacterized protein n=1 Tax=Sphingobium cupriresistens LL01 TaxID=1420583 RepID=A0A0J7XT24_9SPHN|nr:hypothetical protein V473_17195 [Sphingobium cupriresistens LL01]
MLPGPVAAQRVEPITRRIAQVVEGSRTVEQLQFIKCAILNVGWQFAAALAVPDFLCFGVIDAANHGLLSSKDQAF